jgi:NAD(P)-dependent dehydrogenase (short-subunit alcohol dehydrogenase family)
MVLEHLSLKNKVALITGAGRGLGRAMALAMAQAGCEIVAVARTRAQLEETATMVRQQGGSCAVIPADVTRSAEVNAMVERAVAELGHLDVLINNAGGGSEDYGKPLEEISDEMWQAGIALNLSSQFYCCRAVIPHLIAQQHGRIINIASGLGLRGGKQMFSYTCAKGAVIQLTRSLAVTYARYNIQSNCIVPGVFGEAAERFRGGKFVPMGRAGEYEEIGPLAVFLASDAAHHLNGAMLTIDGGALAGGATPTGSYPQASEPG